MPSTALARERAVAAGAGVVAIGPDGALPGPDLQARAGEAATLLKALANPGRLLLLCQLVDAQRSVGELGALTGLAQPSLSQQLGVLRGERLVATRREGKQVIYRIASPAVLAVLQTLYTLFCEPQVRRTQGAPAALTRRVRKETA